MQKNYCDYCGKELHHHKGYFIKPIKIYKVRWFNWNVIDHSRKDCYSDEELCEECYQSFCNCYDDWAKSRKK